VGLEKSWGGGICGNRKQGPITESQTVHIHSRGLASIAKSLRRLSQGGRRIETKELLRLKSKTTLCARGEGKGGVGFPRFFKTIKGREE